MFKIYDGRDSFYQFDLNQKLIVNDDTITEVHFCNGMDSCALVCEVYSENGTRLVNVPNIVLQSDFRLKVWGYAEDHTKHETFFKVNGRSKPADYIYTETEVKSYEAFEERLKALEENSDLSEYVKKTDIATPYEAGVVKVNATGGISINPDNNTIYISYAGNNEIDGKTSIRPIVPANLEYAVKSVGDGYYAKKDDYAKIGNHGVVSTQHGFGVMTNANGILYTTMASNQLIDEKSNEYNPIVPANLEYAVNSVVGNQIGDIDRALINIMNIQGSYMSQGYSVMTLEEGEINE